MSNEIEELAQFGVYCQQNFLSPLEANRLTETMLASESTPSQVYLESVRSYAVDPERRRNDSLLVPSDTREQITASFTDAMAKVGAHFSRTLTVCQPLEFLRYGPGDCFLAHTDSAPAGSGSPEQNRRAISMVLFANGQGPGEGQFGGGELTLCVFGTNVNFGIDLAPEAGLLVAFPSSMMHEVLPVESGIRCSVTGWIEASDWAES